MCDLETMVLTTPFSSQALIDWIDQAILWVYTGEHQPVLKAANIRRATQLIAIFDGEKQKDDYHSAIIEGLLGIDKSNGVKAARNSGFRRKSQIRTPSRATRAASRKWATTSASVSR